MLIEIILGERAPGADAPIQYSVVNEGFRATINGETVFEPVAPLRALFAKLKVRDNILGAVLARLGAAPGSDMLQTNAAMDRLIGRKEDMERLSAERGDALTKLAQGLGLSATEPGELAAQALAMNTELTAALSSSQAEVKALTEENARLRAEVEQKNGLSVILGTGVDLMAKEMIKREAEAAALKHSLEVRELERVLACARVTGLAAELQEFERAMREKLRT